MGREQNDGLPEFRKTPDISDSVIRKFREEAEAGNADARYELGCILMEDEGAYSDREQALRWFRLAAEQGHVKARRKLHELGVQDAGAKQTAPSAVPGNNTPTSPKGTRSSSSRGRKLLIGGVSLLLLVAVFFAATAFNQWRENRSRDELHAAATQGDATAQYRVGEMHLTGEGAPQNREIALVWFIKSAEQGNKDALQAVEKLSEEGNSAAQYALGRMHHTGEGVAPSPETAVAWYAKSAAQGSLEARTALMVLGEEGNASAQHALGELFLTGKGIPQNAETALSWFSKAAIQGNEESRKIIDRLAEEGDPSARQILGELLLADTSEPGNMEKALSWFLKAAAQGNENSRKTMEKLAHDGVASAQNEIGTMYLEGKGYPRSVENALTWFVKAAGQGNEAARKSIETMSEAGDAGAQYALGAMHLSGTGYPQDAKRALDLFFKAAAHGNEDALAAITSLVNEGNPVAQYVLGEMYLEGKGYPQNTETALKWFFQSAARGYGESLQELRKLADGGNATAQHMLGTLHLEGRGVERDSFRALDFFFKAAVQGNKDASKAIERMAEAGDTGAKGYLQHLSQAELAGSLVAWGSNRYAKLDVPPGSDFVSVAAGGSYAVALKKDGSLVAWGDDYFGQTKVPQGSDFLEITAGMSHSLALKNDGSLVAWGSTRDGRLNVPQGRDFIAVAAGRYHSLGLKRDGSLAGWGSNTFGECNVPRGTDFIAIAAGASHSLALKKDGSLIAWGSNSNNQLNVPRGTDFIAIAAGDTHSLALKRDGSIVAWGRNENGQCDAPRGIDFVAIAAGTLHSLALRKDGTVVAWGASYYGQLDVPRNRKFTAISAGSDLSVGIYK